MLSYSSLKILFPIKKKNNTLQCRNSLPGNINNFIRCLYFMNIRNITIQNRSHDPDCDNYGNKKKSDKSVANKLVAANYLQKLLIGDRTLVNALESIGDAKLLMHLIDSSSSVQQKQSNYPIQEASSNTTKQAGEATPNEIHTLTKKPEITSKNMLQSCSTVQLQKNLQLSLKNNNDRKILLLNDDNFRSATLKYKLVLVMFYAPWCKYCNDMKPMFRRVAKELPKGVGCIAFCNAEDSAKVALEHNVYVYPALKLFREGKYLKDYEGPRRSLELLKFIVQHSKQDDDQ